MKTICTHCVWALLLCLLLTACTTPVVAPTPTPTATIAPTPVPTATLKPTATPRTEPYTPEECEKILEGITGTDVTYMPEKSSIDSLYEYKDETHSYRMNRLNGKFCFYINHCETSTKTLSIEDLEQIAKNEIEKYCPNFFDLEADVEKHNYNNEHQIYFFQLSPINSRRTGNSGHVTIQPNGEICSLAIFNNEDPTIADKPLKISKEQALEIAYEASMDKIKAIIENKPDSKIEVADRSKHDIKIDFKVWKNIPTWHISIKFPNNLNFIVGYIYNIDANTGEVTMSDRYK